MFIKIPKGLGYELICRHKFLYKTIAAKPANHLFKLKFDIKIYFTVLLIIKKLNKF
jgi:hypothetical protein